VNVASPLTSVAKLLGLQFGRRVGKASAASESGAMPDGDTYTCMLAHRCVASYQLECAQTSHSTGISERQLTPAERTVVSQTGQILQAIQRTCHAPPAAIEHVGVNHCRAHVLVAEEFLHGADVVAGLKQMGGERMAQGMATRRFGNSRIPNGPLDGPLQDLLIEG
jgi:hypothetical protein